MLRIYKIKDKLEIAEQVRFDGIDVFAVRDKHDYILIEFDLMIDIKILKMDNIIMISKVAP